MRFPDLNPIAFSTGPFQVRWYGLMYLFGIGGAILLLKRPLKRRLGLTGDQIMTLVTVLLVGIILGGRLGYILFYDLAYYLGHPLEIWAYWRGGMSYHGGALGCVLALLWFSRSHRVPLLPLLDYLAMGSTLGLALGRIGNFINGELYGRITRVSWGMVFPTGGPLPRHPSQLYEAVLEGPILFLCLWMAHRWGRLKDGQVFALYLVLYGTFRFFLEFFREPDLQLGYFWGVATMGQLLCMAMIVVGLGLGLKLQVRQSH
ncbi:MAG: prolipoprotein diacylglyceryl transferase [Candidatus Margulisiibacteriota bacterium]